MCAFMIAIVVRKTVSRDERCLDVRLDFRQGVKWLRAQIAKKRRPFWGAASEHVAASLLIHSLTSSMAGRAEPLSIESLLQKQKAEKEAASKVRKLGTCPVSVGAYLSLLAQISV